MTSDISSTATAIARCAANPCWIVATGLSRPANGSGSRELSRRWLRDGVASAGKAAVPMAATVDDWHPTARRDAEPAGRRAETHGTVSARDRAASRRRLQFRALSQPRPRRRPGHRAGSLPARLSRLRRLSGRRRPRLDLRHRAQLLSQLAAGSPTQGASRSRRSSPGRRRRRIAIDNVASDDDSPETALLRRAESGAVRAVLNKLPRRLREILVLRELEGLSYRQIAEIAALPIGTVMSRLARARTQFESVWRAESADAGEAT